MSHPHDETVEFRCEEHFRSRVHERFEQLKAELIRQIPDADIQHVGSTAIPGSLTKGDLDIQVRVAASTYPSAKQRLTEFYPINAGGFAADDAISFEDYSSVPSVGIHLTVIDGSGDIQWRFRDLLAASDRLRREYDDLKRQFEGKSMEDYREAKHQFITRVFVGD